MSEPTQEIEPKKRDARCVLVLGTNGTGKTSFCKQKITQALQSNRKALIISANRINWMDVPLLKTYKFKGARLLMFEPGILQTVFDNYRDGLLILDDFRDFGLKDKDDFFIRRFLINRKQFSIDIFIAAHGFTDIVPVAIYTYINTIVLFKTNDNPRRVSHVLNHIDDIMTIKNEVDTYSEERRINDRLSYYKIIKL